VTRASERRAAVFRGRVVVSPGTDWYGFVEPERGGGEVLFRGSSVASGFRLCVGASVRYAPAGGTFALKAVAVTRSDVDGEREERG
jgi:cold shock CspA family protein